MSRAQTGISPLIPKYSVIVSFRVRDIPMCAMSIGHVAANVPGLANEFRKLAPGSNLVYTIGFGSQLWNFTWQGALPPGFSHLEVEENEEDENEDNDDSGPDLIFCLSASQPDILHEVCEQSQIHLKKIADIHEMTLTTLVENPEDSQLSNEEPRALISKKFPEYAESSYLLALRLTHSAESAIVFPSAVDKILKDSRLIHHLNTWKTEKEYGHYLLAFCDHVKPFQDILDRLAVPSADSLQARWNDIQIRPSLFFLPSLEILAGFRMGTLRIGPLSPTARWK